MGLIQDELSEVKKLCERVIAGSKLVSCVQTMVRIEIKRTPFKHLIVCIQFPENYPHCSLLFELKSKTLSEKFLAKLTEICENELKKLIGKPQILNTLTFIKQFIDEYALCCCYDEIVKIKELLGDNDEIKLRQKSSNINLKIYQDQYNIKCKLHIADDYPLRCVVLQNEESNFPPVLQRYIFAEAREIARKCVEPPLKKQKPNEPPFKPGPSLQKVASFLIDCVKILPFEHCQVCEKECLPADPSTVEKDELADKHVERIYCGHLFHRKCFIKYLKLPPFENKCCPKCGKTICYPKWNSRMAENRWAHEQARERELEEVTDFFK